jgi:hypothetical protein
MVSRTLWQYRFPMHPTIVFRRRLWSLTEVWGRPDSRVAFSTAIALPGQTCVLKGHNVNLAVKRASKRLRLIDCSSLFGIHRPKYHCENSARLRKEITIKLTWRRAGLNH